MGQDEKLLYKIWLSQTCGFEPKRISKVLAKYETAEKAFHANHYSIEFSKLIKLENVLKIRNNLDKAKEFLSECEDKNISIISIDDAIYPNRLKEISNPPQLLFCKGDFPDLNNLVGISVVGTRSCSKEGENISYRLSEKLAESGIVIISGMALGIDGAAHAGAMRAGGTTIAVLAGGVDKIYPMANKDLYGHIQNYGAIISERPPGMTGRKEFYSERNRIIAGLSNGVLFVEGKKKSGTSITAKYATDYNRDIFAVPGKPTDVLAELQNDLIRDGAKVVVESLDIIEEYISNYSEMLNKGIELKRAPLVGGNANKKNITDKTIIPTEVTEKKAKYNVFWDNESFKDEEKIVLDYLLKNNGQAAFDDIVENCDILASSLGGMMIILQMKKAVMQSAGGMYILKND